MDAFSEQAILCVQLKYHPVAQVTCDTVGNEKVANCFIVLQSEK